MQYEELLKKLSENKDFRIYENKYSPQHFGNFNIEFYYKDKMKLRIMNDRDCIEIFLLYHSLFSDAVPLDFAIDFLKNDISPNKRYIFSSISDAYIFLKNSIVYLDEILEKDLLKHIYKVFKRSGRIC